MKRYLLCLLCAMLLFCVMCYVVLERMSLNVDAVNIANQSAAEDVQSSQGAGPEETAAEVTPEPESEPEYFTLSAIGDCTLAPRPNSADFVNKVNGDFSYPFANTVQYFENDEFTIANLECTFSDRKLTYDYTVAMFYFLAGSDYANILTQGGVDFVTTANNHSYDFFQVGVDETCASLEAVGLPYGIEDQAQIVESKNGIRFGIYTAYNDFYPDAGKAAQAIAQMKNDGADYIICMFHWGKDEVVYTPKQEQIDLARACVDAGADLVYGSHAHCLQPIEEYKDSVILYGMGNWSFGGSDRPRDPDTAIVQITLRRDADGSISNDGITVIPCRVSSKEPDPNDAQKYAYNDYKHTPYDEGSAEYERVISKLNGSYEGGDIPIDYSSWYQRG